MAKDDTGKQAAAQPKGLAIVREDFTLADGRALRKGQQITDASLMQDIRDGDQTTFIITLNAS